MGLIILNIIFSTMVFASDKFTTHPFCKPGECRNRVVFTTYPEQYGWTCGKCFSVKKKKMVKK